MSKIKCKLCGSETELVGLFRCLENWKTGLYRCTDCKSMFRHPMPTQKQLRTYYNQRSLTDSELVLRRRLKKSKEQAIWLYKNLKRLKINKDAIIIDIGAGIGGLVYELKELGYRNTKGIEPRKVAIDFGKKRLNIDLIQTEMEDLHQYYKKKKLVLLLSHVSEHIPDVDQALDYLKKYFPGSLLFIEVPDGGYESFKRNSFIAQRLWLSQHLWSFTEQGLKEIFKKKKFQLLVSERIINSKLMTKARQVDLNSAVIYAEIAKKQLRGEHSVFNYFLLLRTIMWDGFLKLFAVANRTLNINRMPDSPFNLRLMVKIL